MREEILEILKMLEAKKITAQEAAQLLEALEHSKKSEETEGPKKGKTLKIRVYEDDRDKPKVNINLPVSWIKILGRFIPQKVEEKLETKGYDVGKIIEEINSGQAGKIVEIEDEGKRVEIYVE